jgi:hypothetical protein
MAEDVTLGLGGILGESTNLKPLNDRPFTKAAQAELTLGLAQKKEDARLATEKAKIDREYMNMIKPISTGDKIADENITKGYIDLVGTGNFRNWLAVKKFQDMSAFQKQAVEDERKWKSNIDKISLEPEVEEAFRNNDQTKLKGMLAIPTANVGYDSETQRFYPKQVFNKMDLNKVTPAVLNFDSQTPLNQSDWKVATDPNGHKYASVSVDPQVKEAKLNELINDKDYRENFRIKYKDKVNIEMVNSKVDLPTAIKTVMAKELDPYFRVQKDIKDVPKASGSGSKYSKSYDGTIFPLKGSGFTAVPQADGSYLMNTSSTGGITEQNITVTREPELIIPKGQTVKTNTNKTYYTNPKPEVIKMLPTKSNYLGGDMWEVYDNNGIKYKTDTKAMQSFYGVELIDEMKKGSVEKPYKSGFVPASKATTTAKPKGKTMTSAEYRKLTPTERSAFKTSGGKVEG